jgi:hypothetical protein
VFHKADCQSAAKISEKNLIRYATRDEAIQAGKKPCHECNPEGSYATCPARQGRIRQARDGSHPAGGREGRHRLRARGVPPAGRRRADCRHLPPERLQGEHPVVLAADKGFCLEKSKFEELAKLVVNLAIPQRMQDFMDKLLASCQAFRAGIEGTISGLKRAFRWVRCFFRRFTGNPS